MKCINYVLTRFANKKIKIKNRKRRPPLPPHLKPLFCLFVGFVVLVLTIMVLLGKSYSLGAELLSRSDPRAAAGG